MSDELQTTEEVTEETEVVTPATSETTETETPQTPEVEEQPEGDQPDGQGNEQDQPQQPPVDYKQKFVDSQREAILLNERNKQKDAQLNKLTSKDAPTDDEMRGLYSNWEELDEGSKTFYRDKLAQERQLKQTQNQVLTLSERIEFQEKLDEFIYEPPAEFKGLKGKESEFKRFTKKKDNIGLPLETLAKAFLFDASDDLPPTHPPTLTPGLENGTGGPRQAPKPKKLTGEQAKTLRETNYREYLEAVKAGKIEEEF